MSEVKSCTEQELKLIPFSSRRAAESRAEFPKLELTMRWRVQDSEENLTNFAIIYQQEYVSY